MEEYNYDDQGYDDYDNPPPQKSIRGYQIIIVVLAVILGVLAFIYYRQVKSLKDDFEIERQELNAQFQSLVGEYDNLRTTNDTINIRLAEQRHFADSVMERLTSERRLNASKIREYQTTEKMLRATLEQNYRTLDSLNKVNQKLANENIEFRRQVTTERLRADKAEETATELSVKVQRGSVIIARGITLTPTNERDREVNRVARASKLRTTCSLTANELASPGKRNIYVRIFGPDGYLLANPGGNTFEFEDEARVYSAVRPDVDYRNEDLTVNIFYNSLSGATAGNYKVEIYIDGRLSGTSEINLR